MDLIHEINSDIAVQAPNDGRANTQESFKPKDLQNPYYLPSHVKILEEADLSPIQEERLITLEQFYDTKTSLLMLSILTPNGYNKWKPLIENIYAISEVGADQEQFKLALPNKIDLGKCYSSRDIMRIVNNTRREYGSKPHFFEICKNCVADLSSIFMMYITQEERTEGSTSISNSYIPFLDLSKQLK